MQQQGDRRQPTTNLAERVLGKDVPACATSWFEVHGVNESDRWLLNALEGLVEVRTAAINLESLEAADREQVSEIVYNHYHNRLGQEMPATLRYTESRRPAGANYFFAWETLTHANNPR